MVKQRDWDFYEKNAQQRISELNSKHRYFEYRTNLYKVLNLCAIMEGLKPKSVLDFGCGLGGALNILASKFQIRDAIGIDISSTIIAYAKKEYPEYTFIQGNREKLRNIHVDLVTFFDVLEHLEDIPGILRLARNSANYIGIKIPLEKTWLISLLNNLHLKEKKSRFYSAGHLYEFNQIEVERILRQAGLKILNKKSNFQPKEIQFSDITKNRMKAKSGYLAKLKYCAYTALTKFPYRVTCPLFQLINSRDFFVLCQAGKKKDAHTGSYRHFDRVRQPI
jgi:ubiquinone/menaquinone biosynthesis C-methylase UbiE